MGYIAVTAAAACWGTSGIFIKLIMSHSGITATPLAFWRDLTTCLVFVCVSALFRGMNSASTGPTGPGWR